MKLIAETAWHHDGDFDFFKQLVNSIAKETNTNYIKFHVTLDIDEYIHVDHPGYEWVKKSVFNEKQWDEIFNIVLSNNKKLMLLFNDKKAIDFGMQYNPELIEIHSVCLNDIFLLRHLKNKLTKDTKVVLGIGGSDIYEVENAINLLSTNNIVLMHGFQNYPTKYEDINLSKMRRIMQMYSQFEHGYADHTAWDNENNILITLFGASLGMTFIEKHVTISTGKGRTDWQAAISIDIFNDLCKKLEILKTSNGNGFMELNAGEKSYSTFGAMKKAAILNKNVSKGDKLTLESINFKRTGQTSDLSQINIIDNIGSVFSKELKAEHCLTKNDLQK